MIDMELLLKPISEAEPCGISGRYEPEFEELKTEVDKITNLSGGEVDWAKVQRVSTQFLSQKSKDLLVAGWLTMAAFQLEGYPALAQGFETLRKLIETYWATLFPELRRLRARISAFEWLSERLAIAVALPNAPQGTAEEIQKVLDQVRELDRALTKEAASDAPSFGPLYDALGAKILEAPSAAPPSAAAPPAVAEPAPPPPMAAAAPAAAPLAPPPPIAGGSPEALETAVKDTLAHLRGLARELRLNQPSNPLGYRLARIAAWGRVRALPPHTEGRTRIPAQGAGPEFLQRINGLAEQGKWSLLLDQAETQFSQSVFWFDLQRFSFLAMERLGSEYTRARQILKEDLAGLLRDFPALIDLAFESGQLFADQATREWINSEVLAGPAGAAGPPALAPRGAAREADEEFAETVQRAREFCRSNREAEAVALVQAAADALPPGRRQFLRRLELIRMLTELKEYRLASARLDLLDDDVRLYRLEQWEPALAIETLMLALACQRALVRSEPKAGQDAVRRADELFNRLARLDAAAALAMKP